MREIYIFVGENRSKTAKENGYSWQECQRTGKPVLSAIRLFDALSKNGLDPRAQVIFNLWNDDGSLNRFIPEILMELAEDGETIIAMGQKVQAELQRLGIEHKPLIHPAARGKIASKVLYRKHFREVLG